MNQVENGAVVSTMYLTPDHEQKELKVFGHCDGCGLAIEQGELFLDWGTILLHDESRCIIEFARDEAIKKEAGA